MQGGRVNSGPSRPLTPARGISLDDNQYNFTFREPVQIYSNFATDPFATLVISAGPGTDFTNSCDGVLTTPISEADALIVINPLSATQYALDGQIFYTRRVDLPRVQRANVPSLWGIETIILFMSSNSTETGPTHQAACALSPSSEDNENLVLPIPVFNDLLSRIESAGISIERRPFGVFVGNATRRNIAQLLSIEFVLVEHETGQLIRFAEWDPRMYIESISVGQATTARLSVRTASTSIPNYCRLDYRVLKNLLIHFDTQNNRIGFGEPLVELLDQSVE